MSTVTVTSPRVARPRPSSVTITGTCIQCGMPIMATYDQKRNGLHAWYHADTDASEVCKSPR